MSQQRKELPFSLEAEDMVLGSILIDGTTIDSVVDILDATDFIRDQNRIIYTAIINAKESGAEINEATVTFELHRLNASPLVPVLHLLISQTPTSAFVKYYAEIVRRCAIYRYLIVIGDKISNIGYEQPSNVISALDESEALLHELRLTYSLGSRKLIITRPRLIQTNPPRYIWNVNGKDLRLNLAEITMWGKFKNRVISELDFVPIKPKGWDEVVNSLVSNSRLIEAPLDASEEVQLMVFIQRWFERMKEASEYSDLAVGRHIIRKVGNVDYYFFKSTPLLTWLRKEFKKGISSEDLWVYAHKWGGIKHKLRVKTQQGSTPVNLWGIPIEFAEEEKIITTEGVAPDWF